MITSKTGSDDKSTEECTVDDQAIRNHMKVDDQVKEKR
jgi:hypothetical protein